MNAPASWLLPRIARQDARPACPMTALVPALPAARLAGPGPRLCHEGRGFRDLSCPSYLLCLRIASNLDWAGFSCAGCSRAGERLVDVAAVARASEAILAGLAAAEDEPELLHAPMPARAELEAVSRCGTCGADLLAPCACHLLPHPQRPRARGELEIVPGAGLPAAVPILQAAPHEAAVFRGRRRHRPCAVAGCDQDAIARSLCRRHYDRWRVDTGRRKRP